MGLLQTCGYVTEQMQTKVSININKNLEVFSIEDDGHHIHPPPWMQSELNSSSSTLNQSHTGIQQSTAVLSSEPAKFPDFDNYCISRQAEAIRWINLQEKRSSIIARVQPTTAKEYQQFRNAVTSDSGPFRRTSKGTRGICSKSNPCHI